MIISKTLERTLRMSSYGETSSSKMALEDMSVNVLLSHGFGNQDHSNRERSTSQKMQSNAGMSTGPQFV